MALAPPTIAADLGGNCCGNLEERIADLEATTARKGNRKVSLTVSGWINEALFWWDDGTQQNVYEGTNMVEQSRVKFLGEAKVDKDWSAGYLLEIAVQGHPNREWNQFTSNSVSSNPVNKDDAAFPRKSYWFLKSKTYGQIAIALNGMATFHLLDDTDPTMTRNIDDAEGPPIFMSAFLIRSNGNFVNKLTWPNILRGFNNSTPGDAARRNVVRYDAPASQGLTLSASWGEDDLWDAALTYKQQFGEFRVVARAGYGASNDPGVVRSPTLNPYVVGGNALHIGYHDHDVAAQFRVHLGGCGSIPPARADGTFPLRRLGASERAYRPRFPSRHRLRAGQHDVVHPPRRREEMVRPRTDRDLRELSS